MYNSADVTWTLVAAFLVFFMQAGFALCEAGLTRAKNTGNILMKNMMDFCIGTPCYWLVGFGIMFAGSSALIGGFDPFIQGTSLLRLPCRMMRPLRCSRSPGRHGQSRSWSATSRSCTFMPAPILKVLPMSTRT